MWFIPFAIVFVIFFTLNSKIEFLKLRTNSKKILAEVVEYRKERSQMRNDYTLLNYPYVKIETEKDEYIIVKLRHANNWSKSFEIGEKIFVFWNGSDLLYWNGYDKGIYKYLPEKWSFKK